MLIIVIIIVATIFLSRDNPGLNHTKGNISGPIHKKVITKKDVPKYHLFCGGLTKNSLQKRHFTAWSCIVSAQ
ncbi:MAG: hypothetical protein M0R20_02405 [Candidatus Omnitrophica bacterium]|nr:hypothetical protein [Candidatus Omnitrophota bacterium]